MSLAAIGGLSTLAEVGSVASGVVGAVGAIASANAQSAAAKYNAEVAQQNAKIAQQNAAWAGQAGEQQAAVEQQKTRARVGAIVSSEAANNIDVNSGSAVDVRSSASELGELSALTIRSNAAKEAYGDVTQSWSQQAQANLDKQNAAAAESAGMIGATSSLLGGVEQGANEWRLWNAQNGALGA